MCSPKSSTGADRKRAGGHWHLPTTMPHKALAHGTPPCAPHKLQRPASSDGRRWATHDAPRHWVCYVVALVEIQRAKHIGTMVRMLLQPPCGAPHVGFAALDSQAACDGEDNKSAV
eukprot:6607716-Prymnesium_polylepis.2